jgi:hypothetical protein
VLDNTSPSAFIALFFNLQNALLIDRSQYNCFECYCTYMGTFGVDEENLLPVSSNALSCCEYPTES